MRVAACRIDSVRILLEQQSKGGLEMDVVLINWRCGVHREPEYVSCGLPCGRLHSTLGYARDLSTTNHSH